ncbi:MAG TPA: hypothetical protein VHL58_17630, partial [Thermoanaerobaculia bacterium]|nr:hypothetical protein [Thermoanaerobaculia bacterium]
MTLLELKRSLTATVSIRKETKLMSIFRRALPVLVLLVSSTVSAEEAKPLPEEWSVHVDRVEPRSARSFEQLCAEQARRRSEVMKERHLVTAPRYEIELTGFHFLTLRPKSEQAPLSDGDKQLLEARVGVLDDDIHRTLRSHHNESWQLDSSSSYVAPSAKRPRYVKIWSDVVRPEGTDRYNAAMARLPEAARKLNLPSFL